MMSIGANRVPGVDVPKRWSPMFLEDEWQQMLLQQGFSGIDVSFRDYESQICHQETVAISTALDLPTEGISQRIIILQGIDTTSKNVALDLEHSFMNTGFSVEVTQDFSSKIRGDDIIGAIVISALEIEMPHLAALRPEDFDGLMNIFKFADRLIWLKPGGGSKPEFSVIDGLARTAKAERGDIAITTIALDVVDKLSELQIKHILHTVGRMQHIEPKDMEAEQRQTETGFEVARMDIQNEIFDEIFNHLMPLQAKEVGLAQNMRLQLLSAGEIFLSTDCAPRITQDGTVEVMINVCAVSDGLRSDDSASIAMGVAGIVSRVSPDNTFFRPGDRVCGIASSPLANYAAVDYRSIVLLPEALPLDIGASTSESFLKAYCAFEIACVKLDDCILLCGAASECRDAFLQLAQYHGQSRVFILVEVELDAERVANQYDLPKNAVVLSTDRIPAASIDVVFDLPSARTPSNIDDCLAPFARVFDLSHEDKPTRLSASNRCNAQYMRLSMAEWVERRPQTLANGLQLLLKLLALGKLQPTTSLYKYSVSKWKEAFQSTSRGRQTLIEFESQASLQVCLFWCYIGFD